MPTRISALITDLDNTVYDWLSSFVPAFYAMVEEAIPIIGVDREMLLDDLQAVHRRHASSEHPFSLLETEAVRTRFPGSSQAELLKALDPALHTFNRVRKERLKLYDGVLETLEQLNRKQVPVIAYTDARVTNSLFRIERLGIKQLLARLYAPAPIMPDPLNGAMSDGFVYLLPPSDRKPNPQTLLDICSHFGVVPAETLYVGDSLARDIYMARQAGVHSAWVKFGTIYDRALWPQLVRVTHWTDVDVVREKELKSAAEGTQPDHVLETFSNLLKLFHFEGKEARLNIAE